MLRLKLLISALSFFILGGNVLALGAVADFGALNCHSTTKADERQNVQLTTSPTIEPNACYMPAFLS